MALQIRRVVTGHDANGKAIVTFDDFGSPREARNNIQGTALWTTVGFPVDNTGAADTALGVSGTTLANGSVFRVVEFGPNNAQRVHRTDSIDYAIVLYGEIDMELDDGASVHLKGGEVVVQRGTIHNWVNKGTVPCAIAFILIDAKPVEVGGKVLNAQG